ncbi:transcription factor VBP-like [Anneissia japonica]|uniref:transcription factor VBP-like n=1 Tax=Anneissia japonica TaxID=1529436 RepID=UPI0014257708|nr:transcription factor VBP-like [Anneissia japonica]
METKRLLSPTRLTRHTDAARERSVSPSSSGHISPPTKSEALNGISSSDTVSRFNFGPLHRRPTPIPVKPLDLSNFTRMGTSAVSSTTPFKIYPYSHMSAGSATPTYNFSQLDHSLHHPSSASYPSSYPPAVYPYALSSDAPLTYNSLRLSALLVSRKRSRQTSGLGGEGKATSVCSDEEGDTKKNNPVPIKKSKGIPDEKKDDMYWERRRKNNDAAKRSRDTRRAKEEEIAIRAMCLEQENWKLRTEVCCLKTEIARLHSVYNHY